MKKDIEWLRREVKKLEDKANKRNQFGSEYTDEEVALEDVKKLINQLDEPEVLSLDWIDDNKKDSGVHSIGYYVPIGRLHDLLVPKQEEVEEGRVRLIVGFDGGTESYYATDIGDALDFLTDYDARFTVSKEPVIPKFVADWLEENNRSLLLIGYMYYENNITDSKLDNWISENTETLYRACLDGYEIKQEPKYYVLIKGKSSYLGHTGCFLFKEDNDLTIYTGDNLSAFDKNNERYQFTEQEIKDYDERYCAFAEPVEELEE